MFNVEYRTRRMMMRLYAFINTVGRILWNTIKYGSIQTKVNNDLTPNITAIVSYWIILSFWQKDCEKQGTEKFNNNNSPKK